MIARLYDSHTHWEGIEDLQMRSRQSVFSLVCAKTFKEYLSLSSHLQADPALQSSMLITAGLHPWHCLEEPVEQMLELFPKVKVVGEIGMDSVWCQVDLDQQRKVFSRQLECASKLGKPVILHTKGQEETIAGMIADYPNRYLVHWYSGESWRDLYEKQDCWFTIGPDVSWNKITKSLARAVRADRLLIETDGMEAVRWADRKGHILAPGEQRSDVREVLLQSLKCCARIRHQETEELARLCRDNLASFLGFAV